jgi:hypothetical protein
VSVSVGVFCGVSVSGVRVLVVVGVSAPAVEVDVAVGVSIPAVELAVAVGVSTTAVEVAVTVGVFVDVCGGGGAEVLVGFGGGCVVGGGLAVSVTGCSIGVRVGTVPCESGIAQTTGSKENSVNMVTSNIMMAVLDLTIFLVLPSLV